MFRLAVIPIRQPRVRGGAAYAGMALLVMALHFEQALAMELRGHFKPQTTVVNLPGNSLLQDFSDDPARDIGLDLRLNLSTDVGGWSWHSDYQLIAVKGDQLELRQQNPNLGFNAVTLADDEQRVFDLSHRISDQDDDIVARQLREAAEKETDPELKKKLWKEYENYKNSGS